MGELMTTDEVVDKVDSEGLGYTIESYVSASGIADPQLARLWQTAADALKAVGDHLDEHRLQEEGDLDDEDADPATSGRVQTHGAAPRHYVDLGLSEQLFLDEMPGDLFTGASLDHEGRPRVDLEGGGSVCVMPEGGLTPREPVLFFSNRVTPDELLRLLDTLAPFASRHIAQTIYFRDEKERRGSVILSGGQALVYWDR